MSMDVVSVICRSQRPTLELSAVSERTQGLYFDRPCGDGWWWGAYTDAELYGDAQRWLAELERTTRAPVLIALDMDSDCVDLTGHDPGGWWRACLIRGEMQSYLDEDDATVEEMFPPLTTPHFTRQGGRSTQGCCQIGTDLHTCSRCRTPIPRSVTSLRISLLPWACTRRIETPDLIQIQVGGDVASRSNRAANCSAFIDCCLLVPWSAHGDPPGSVASAGDDR